MTELKTDARLLKTAVMCCICGETLTEETVKKQEKEEIKYLKCEKHLLIFQAMEFENAML